MVLIARHTVLWTYQWVTLSKTDSPFIILSSTYPHCFVYKLDLDWFPTENSKHLEQDPNENSHVLKQLNPKTLYLRSNFIGLS